MTIWILIAVYFAATMLWWDSRVLREEGIGLSKPTLIVVVSVFAAILGYSAIGPWGLIPVTVAMHSLFMKPDKFIPNTRSWFMVFRYALPAALSVAPAWFGVWTANNGSIGYVGACLLAGTAYPALQRYAPEEITDHLTQAVVGAAVIGGLVLL